MIADRFGFLPCDWTFVFDGGTVSPIPEIYKHKKRVDKYTNEDGFLYPPLSYSVRLDLQTNKVLKRFRGSERPAHLHRVPPSHELRLPVSDTVEEFRKGRGAFIIHLLAYLFGIRLQFHDWWFDSRVPIRMDQTHNIHPSKATAEDFLSHCYRVWQGWRTEEQKLMTNVIFMHSRAPLYEWDWERFAVEYMVFDGCWKLARLQYGIRSAPHPDRIKIACERFGIPCDEVLVGRIVALRNNLFHETLWDTSQPCTAVSDDASRQPYNLRQLNQRLVPALLGYNNQYVHSIWWSLSARLFDKLTS
jgi:hypothetical protein